MGKELLPLRFTVVFRVGEVLTETMLAPNGTTLGKLACLFGALLFTISMNASNQLPKIQEIYGLEFRVSVADAQKLHERAEDYFYAAKYREGIQSFEAALQEVEKSAKPNERDIANILATMAEGHMQLGEMEKASGYLKRGLAMADGAAIPSHAVVARILKDQVLINLLQGDLSQAPTLLSRCLEIQKASYAPEHPAFGPTLQASGLLLLLEGNYPEATDAIERSSAIIRKAFGHENVIYGQNLNILAMIEWKQGDFAGAVSSCERSIAILEKILPADHLITGQSLNTLGLVYQGQGKYKDALPVLKRNLGILDKHLGRDHLHVAMNLKIQGLVNLGLEDYSEALRCFERNLQIYENIMRPETAPIATTLNNMALAHSKLGNSDSAAECLERCLRILIKQAGAEHPEVANSLHNLAVVRHHRGESEKAFSLYQQSFDLTVRIYGVEHPKVAVSLESIAKFLLERGQTQLGVDSLVTMFNGRRPYLARQYLASAANDALEAIERSFYSVELLHSACALGVGEEASRLRFVGAEQLALDKAFLEEMQAMKTALEADPQTATRDLQTRCDDLLGRIEKLPQSHPAPEQRVAARAKLEAELMQLEAKLAERNGLVAQMVRERRLTLLDIAQSLPPGSALVDFIGYRPTDFENGTTDKARYAAYLTFPLAGDSTNAVVERVDLGEAAPINEAVELICRRMGAGQFRAKDLEAALQRVSELVYAPLARHLTNVSHLIVCPDGQLSRVPFEMLLVSGRGEPPRYLVEEKTVSYVGSGREVARLAQPSTQVNTNAPVVMGNPDFDFALPGSSRREEALINAEQSQSQNVRPHPGPLPQEREKRPPRSGETGGLVGSVATNDQSLVTSAPTNGEIRLLTSSATKTLSRSYRGIKFGPLPGSEAEAMNVAKLLGGDTVLRLGAEAREAELKAVVSPRVLHLATHGFFLTDQEFKRTNAGPGLLASSARSRRGNEADWVASLRSPPPHVGGHDDWENPMVRCGIALAGANHAAHITNAVAEDGLLTGLEASLLNLQGTELVILSACESGAGEVKIGEGVMSLRRAFRIAGAETVLASHWKVSDQATSRLMTEFMRRWRAGEPRAKAWRAAQLALLRSEKFSNPFFWAAFTLTGQWRW